jgi:hypothetical protein
MNCLEFRRLALANPQHPGPAALEHEAACPACARFYLELRQQEEVLYQALSIPIPEGLADRVLLLARPRLIDRFGPPRVWLPALAATLVLALGLAFMTPRGMSPETLAAGVIAHVRHEPEVLAAEGRVPMAKLVRAFERGGGRFIAGQPLEETLQATHAGRCPLPGGGTGEHIVLRTAQGKVTLILMPSKPVAAALHLFKDGLAVSVLPAGEGSLALVAESDDLVRDAETDLRSVVRWPGSRT